MLSSLLLACLLTGLLFVCLNDSPSKSPSVMLSKVLQILQFLSTIFSLPCISLSPSLSVDSRPSVRSLLSSLAYGPAPESPAIAKAWLEDHGHSFGHFINGGWVKPEGRKTYDTHNPATGEKLASTVQGQLP